MIGYLEGDGTFYLNKHDMTVRVGLVTTTVNRVVLENIRIFLLSHLDEFSYFLASNTKLINIQDKKVKEGQRSISILEIYQIDYICSIFIPFLDKIVFNTKKYLDFIDFKKIAFLLLEGKHLTQKGKDLIIKLANTMNHNRLSTNSNLSNIDHTTQSELDSLIKSKPLINIDSQGRAMIISENKYIRSTYIIKALFLDGSFTYYINGASCAKALQVSNNTITVRLNDGKPVKNQLGLIVAQTVLRIKAYSPGV